MNVRVILPTTVFALGSIGALAAPAHAQSPPPHKDLNIAASIGIAATSGNSDTSQFNAAYDMTYDPQTRNVFKTNALFLRGTTEGDLSAERFLFNVRDEQQFNERAYVFGQNLYLRDRFKSISYLDSMSGGLGYKAVISDATLLDIDAGAGATWEKNLDLDLRTSGSITAGEKLQQKLTSTTSLTQSVTALWKANDFDDALYTFSLGVSVAMSEHIQFKVEILDVYKNKPPNATVRKSDLTTVIALVFKS